MKDYLITTLFFLALVAVISTSACFIGCSTSDDSNNTDQTPSTDSDNSGDEEVIHSDGYIILDDLPEDVWSDPDSGLMWQVWPKYRARLLYYEAIDHCKTLVYGGYDDWRMPSISELRSLIRGCPGTQTGGGCDVTDSCTSSECWNDNCGGCSWFQGPADSGMYWPNEFSVSEKYFYNDNYWSSALYPYSYYLPDSAYCVRYSRGGLLYKGQYSAATARCVR